LLEFACVSGLIDAAAARGESCLPDPKVTFAR
jgi:hypothetical protein